MNKPKIYDIYLKDQSISLTGENIQDICDYEWLLLDTVKLDFKPNKIIEEVIAKNAGYSYRYAIKLLEIFKDINIIPKIIEETISKDSWISCWYIEFFNINNIIMTDETFETFKEYLIP